MKMVEKGKYDHHLLEDYTEEEFQQMDGFLDHWRDMNFSYAAVKQLEGKYLVQNRVTGEIYERAVPLYSGRRLPVLELSARNASGLYQAFLRRGVHLKISLPTPSCPACVLTRQFSSCVLIECGDSRIPSTPPPARL